MTKRDRKFWKIGRARPALFGLLRVSPLDHGVPRMTAMQDRRTLNQTLRTVACRRLGNSDPLCRPEFLARVGGTIAW